MAITAKKAEAALKGYHTVTPGLFVAGAAKAIEFYQRARGAEDRTGCLEDPFGHHWWLAQHLQDLTPEEIRKNAEAHFAQFQPASR